ncbi:Winged helix DNA-binding domain-containing protein [Ruaniaceae bacterium KH17]|nr:Winged helix DNA-binding domain-containing protein [Ruaniaceae bacterium KH17]
MAYRLRPNVGGLGDNSEMQDRSLLRIVAQGLVPATMSESVHGVVGHMLATQGQLASGVPHSLAIRTRSSGADDVHASFDEGRLVRSWPFRGTLHIVTAADHHWLRALWRSRRDSWWEREAARLSLTPEAIQKARDLAAELVAAGPRTRAEVVAAWREEGVAGAVPETERARMLRLLFVELHRDGTIVSGPPGKNDYLVIDAARVPSDARAGRIEAGDSATIREAHAEVARRYATSRGPVTTDDLTRWAGIGKRIAQRALDDAVELTNVPGSGSVPLTTVNDGSAHYYLRADLEDLLHENRKAATGTHFLAPFDELYVGYKDRTGMADATADGLICPGKNGMFRAFVVDRGRVVAARPAGGEMMWAKPPSMSLAARVDRAVRAVDGRLGR